MIVEAHPAPESSGPAPARPTANAALFPSGNKGQDAMKRTRTGDAPPPPAGQHPDASKPLSAFRRITVSCHDCGEATVLEEAQLADLSAVPTFGDLWRLAFCSACRANGATGPANVELRGEGGRAAAPPPEPQWSTKPVFDDDRSDPFPSLPRRPMFGG